MTGKLLIKVTVDETLFPELYQLLSAFENPRLRATALRAFAHDQVRGLSSTVRLAENPSSEHTQYRKPAQSSTRIDAATPTESALPADKPPDTSAGIAALESFQVDAIADQFANF